MQLCSSNNILHVGSGSSSVHLFNQSSRCVLFSVPPVFALHFVEGLPDSDVRLFTFTFKGKRYSVTTVIQYDRQLKHFVTWLCNPDGKYSDSLGWIRFFFCVCEQYFNTNTNDSAKM